MTHKIALLIVLSMYAFTTGTCRADELLLMETPVKVTATLHSLDEGGTEASIAVHNGPVAQLVNTTVTGLTTANASSLLRRELNWRAPYLLVHSSCSINNVRRCGGEVVFKVVDSKLLRLGDFAASENPTLANGRFYDSYDKLGEQIYFAIVLMDISDALQVNGDATWSNNLPVWNIRATHILNVKPLPNWPDVEWDKYFAAIVNNAVIARYCNRTDELQQILDTVNPLLDTDHRRLLADTLSKVIPLEKPKAWRKAF